MCVCVRGETSKNDEEIHKETLSLETYKQIYIRKKDRKTPKQAFLMLHHQLLMVFLYFFPSSFLSFCQISSAGPSQSWSLAFRLHYSPKARPCSIIFLCIPHPRLSSTLTGTKVFPLVLSSKAPISSSFFSLFLPPKTRPMPQPSAVPPPKRRHFKENFPYGS